MSVIEEVREVLQSLPEDTSWDDLEYALYVRRKVREGQADVAAGRTMTPDEARTRLQRWFAE